jgi:hypothetical protein
MMQFPKNKIQDAVNDIDEVASIEVIFNADNILVIAENSQAINEFEARLAARNIEWDEEMVDGVALLNSLTDIQGTRTEFRPRHNDEWQARYSIVAR